MNSVKQVLALGPVLFIRNSDHMIQNLVIMLVLKSVWKAFLYSIM